METNKLQEKMAVYMSQLSLLELKALEIAEKHLGKQEDGGSFNIYKSNGFINWLKTQPK